MLQVIYGDVLLLIDFCMNFFVLYTTGILLRRKTKLMCLIGAALLGGVYSVAKVFVNGNNILDCLISLAVGILMCYISFGGYRFLKTVLVFFGTAAMVGGIMFLIYFFLGSYHADLFGNFRGYAYAHIPLWLFVLLAALSFLIATVFSYVGRDISERKELRVTVKYHTQCETVTLFLDSGNLAKEPISGKNVILLSCKKARTLLGEEIYSAVRSRKSEFLLKRKFRLICASGVDGIMHTYYGFQPDRIFLTDGDEKVEMDVYIAVCEELDSFGGCDGIVHPSSVA